MAEDFGDKTEAPTPRRRQEAREEGNIARAVHGEKIGTIVSAGAR